jgi:hypothetical protein
MPENNTTMLQQYAETMLYSKIWMSKLDVS